MTSPAHPPKAIESIVRWLIPPVCREHVVGDLHERYTSLLQYVVDALSAIPSVVMSQIRRTWDSLLLLSCACLLMMYPGEQWTNLIAPATAALVAILLREAYAADEYGSDLQPDLDAVFDSALRSAAVDVVAAATCAVVVHGLVSAVIPELLLPPKRLFDWLARSALFLYAFRVAWSVSLRRRHLKAAPMAKFQGRAAQAIGGVSMFFISVGAATFSLGWARLNGITISERLAGIVILSILVYIGFRAYQSLSVLRASRDAVDSHSSAAYPALLERRRDVYRRVFSWSVAPYLLASCIYTLQTPVAISPISRVVGFLIWGMFFKRAADQIQEELDIYVART